MNIVVVGAGGVGGYFGGRLAEAGRNVTFLVRGKTFKAINEKGLRVKSIHGDFTVNPKVVDNINELENVDLILLGIKSWQVRDMAINLKPIVSENTLILPLQNGADNEEKLCEILPKRNIIAGFCKVVSKIKEPGVINHMGADPEIVIGEMDNSKTERIKEIHSILSTAKFKCTIAEDIYVEIWKKFLFICTISGLGGLCRVSLGKIREDKYLRNIMEKTAEEMIAIANEKGIALNAEHTKMVFHFIDNLDYNTTASMQRDIMAGRPSELEEFNGYIVRQGKKLNIPTPINAFIYHALFPMEKEARKGS